MSANEVSSSSLQQRPEKRLRSAADTTTTATTTTTSQNVSCTNNRKTSTSATIDQSGDDMMIPTFLKEYNHIEFSQAFENFQAVYIPKFSLSKQRQQQQQQQQDPPVAEKVNASSLSSSSSSRDVLSWKDLSELYSNLSKEDQESWCIETGGKGKGGGEEKSKPSSESIRNPSANDKKGNTNTIKPIDFLQERKQESQQQRQQQDDRYYCSFLVQKDVQSYQKLIDKLPVKTLIDDWFYEPCIWIFFGRNNNNSNNGDDLQGRPEHTDSVSHDGTWHYQLNGIKRWILRPTSKLLQHINEEQKKLLEKKHNNNNKIKKWDESTRIEIECHKGDILVVNTRLWYHQTVIPSSSSLGEDDYNDEPSVSYARDFWTSKSRVDKDCSMTNVDGLYATNDIQEGTIIFKESDMPDCELHRSKDNPNCEIIQLEDGTGAVVSSRPITAGEFFCVPESSSEEEEEDDDDEEEEYDGDEEEEEAYSEEEDEQ